MKELRWVGGRRQIESTGYSIDELAKIEYAFEKGSSGCNDEAMFKGLMSVIECLDVIHKNTDTEVTKVSKQKFFKSCTDAL